MNYTLDRLLRPRSIAVVGGSWANNVIEQCLAIGFDGDIWRVNSNRESSAGIACYRSIDALPAAPDACFIGVNRDASIELVAQLEAQGAGGVVCFAAGFGEAAAEDPAALEKQRALLTAAGRMPLLGPNCYGFINYLDGVLLWPDMHGGIRTQSGVAILTQSSNIAINLTMQQRGLPLAYMVTTGNQAQLSLAAVAEAIILDHRVTAIGLHVEGFTDVRAFESLARRAHQLGKPIIVLKVGKSVAAIKALRSHTGSMVGNAAAADTFLQRLGLVRVNSLSALIESLKILHFSGVKMGRRVLSMSCSGGEAGLVGDAADDCGLQCPALSDTQRSALRVALGSRVALANPLDYHTYIWNDLEAMTAMFRAMLLEKMDVALLVLDFPRNDRCEFPSWFVALEAFKTAGEGWPGMLAVVATLEENMPEYIARQLIKDGIVPLCGLENGLSAIVTAAEAADLADTEFIPTWLPGSLATEKHMRMRATLLERFETGTLHEAAAKAWLQEQELSVPVRHVLSLSVLHGGDTLIAALAQISAELNFPVVVKALGVDHKSGSNAIAINVHTQAQLELALDRLRRDEGFLVEEQIENVLAELLVSVMYDPVHGLMLTLGAGGIMTEVLNDVVHCLLPVAPADIRFSLEQLRCAPVLAGHRGRPGVDWDALVYSVVRIQNAALGLGDSLSELEINPLLCTPDRCVIGDALITLKHT